MQALTLINQMPETKGQIKSFANLVIKSVKDGNINPLDLTIKLKALEDTTDIIRKAIKSDATIEADKYGKSFTYHNAKIDVVMAGVKYDYSNCEDPEWNELNLEIIALSEKRKERETFLKSLNNYLTIVDEDTGETSTIYPPKKTGTETIKITLND